MTGPTTHGLFAAASIAVGTGLHTATWGAFKDSPFEGFHPVRCLRTMVVAVLAALVGVWAGLLDLGHVVPAVGVIYTLERLTTEWWKTIIRTHDAAAFTIPMRLGFRGRPIDVAWRRYVLGVLILGVMIVTGVALHQLQGALPVLPDWLDVLTVGGLGGWLTAVGGAWKDAPIEGFSGWKFLRSPAVATAWAVPLSALTHDWVTLCLAAGGMSVATIETYKTFLTGDRAPGKFAGRARSYEPIMLRRVVGRIHALSWTLLFAVAVAQLVSQVGLASAFASLSVTNVALLLVAAASLIGAQLSIRATTLITTYAGDEPPSMVSTTAQGSATVGDVEGDRPGS